MDRPQVAPDDERVVVGRFWTRVILALVALVSCGPVSLSMWGSYAYVLRAPLVLDAIARAEAHPTIREVLGEPLVVSTLLTRDQDLSYTAGGASVATPFWRPGVILKRISLYTTITGPKGSAMLNVTGTEDLRSGAWRDVRMDVSGGDYPGVRSFRVDLTLPDDPGTVVREQ